LLRIASGALWSSKKRHASGEEFDATQETLDCFKIFFRQHGEVGVGVGFDHA